MKFFVLKKGMLLAFASLLFTVGCSSKDNQPSESITTSIIVEEKAQSDDLTKKWLTASNANTDTIEPVRIEVENEMVWNLIEADREYFVTYQGSPQSGYVLEQIEQTGKDGAAQ